MREFFADLGPSDWIALSAVVIAVASFVWTAWNSWQLGKLNRREHDWQAVDRQSAHVEVTRHRNATIGWGPDGRRYTDSEDWIRFKNTGRVSAENVRYSLWQDTNDISDSLYEHVNPIPTLHPGEWYDVWLVLTVATGAVGEVRLDWSDERGRHSKVSPINL